MRVLGISAHFHDAAAALVEDGRIVAAAEEERFSRMKHDARFPHRAIAHCLKAGGIEAEDLDYVIFYEKPLRKFERILVNQLRTFPHGLPQFVRALGTWLTERVWQKEEMVAALGCDPERVLFSEHHLSHAASAFLCSPFSSAAILTVDGVGEWATTAIWRGVTDEAGTRIEPVREIHFPHSIGLLYSAITAYLGFEVNEGEYKVMGLAAYGKPRHLEAFRELCTIDPSGAIAIDERYFSYHRHPTKSFTPELERLLGPARAPGTTVCERFADIAASLQVFTEEYLLLLAEEAKRETNERALCFAGGVALNSVANRRLLERGPFEELFVQPAAGDSGGALGAALFASHVLLGVARQGPMTSALLGASHEPAEVKRFLEDIGVVHRAFEDRAALVSEVASRLARGEVCAWHQGRFEWGPRALGARSILADPRDARTRDRVNEKVKFRERFRPFAPAVLEEEQDRWFVPVEGRVDHTRHFMGSVAPVTDEAREKIPAVVHVDGTARLQSVAKDRSPALHELLLAFRERTGIGVLLNTSLNLKDEPICASPEDAYATFVRSDLDFLVIEHCLVERIRS
jgi:carbamoyltransferase